MEVGEQDVMGLEQLNLGCLGLLYLHDHVGLGEHGLRVGNRLRTLRHVVTIGDRRAFPRPSLHEDLVPC